MRWQASRRTKWLFSTLILALVAWYGVLLYSILHPTINRFVTRVTHVYDHPIRIDTNTLWYPAVGIHAPLYFLPNTSPLVVQDWPALRTTLQHGVALATTTNSWQESSFGYIIGHSSDTYPHPFSSVFAPLGQASINDLIYMNVSGTLYTFQVDGRTVVHPNNSAYWEELTRPSQSTLRHIALVTCWPVLTTRDRLVITAHEQESTATRQTQ